MGETALATTGNAQLLLKAELEKITPALESILPKHVTAERMKKVVLSATNRQPDLLKCTVRSICQAVMQAGELGLEIGGLLGEAYLVPYNVKVKEKGQADRWEKQAQCIPGYRGFIKLARQSGQLHSISARVVYSHDRFQVNLAQEEIQHEPNFSAEREDKDIVAVYAIARFKDEGRQIEVMTRPEVDRIRKRSKAADGGPWVTDYSEMARKTVVRRICKYLPLSPELSKALEHEAEVDELDRHAGAPIFVTEQHEEKPRAKSIAERIRARAASAEEPKAPEGPPESGEESAVVDDPYADRGELSTSEGQ